MSSRADPGILVWVGLDYEIRQLSLEQKELKNKMNATTSSQARTELRKRRKEKMREIH